MYVQSTSVFPLRIKSWHGEAADLVILIEHVSKANINVLLLGRVGVLMQWPTLSTKW